MSCAASAVDAVRMQCAPGFRLHRLELLDWGPFERGIQVLDLSGRTTLVTGGAAAVQSGVVAAVAALLAPREREAAQPSRAPSVILGLFRDPSTGATITLAQVFWRDGAAPAAERWYVCAERELCVAAHFDFGLDRAELAANLRGLGADVESALPRYSAWLRRRLGVRSARALDLFRPMASARPHGSLDAVVRRHVLEPADIAPRLQALAGALAQAERARDALQEARSAEALLASIVAACDQEQRLVHELDATRTCHAALPAYFARRKLALIDQRMGCMRNIDEQLGATIRRLQIRLAERRAQEADIRVALAQNGGERLERLSAEIKRLVGVRDARRARAERYGELLRRVGEAPPQDEAAFHAQRGRLRLLHTEARERDAYLARALPGYDERLHEVRAELDALPATVARLRRAGEAAFGTAGSGGSAPGAHSVRGGDAGAPAGESALAELEARIRTLELRVAAIMQLIGKEQAQRKALVERLETLARLEEFGDFEALDWASVAGAMAELIDERERLGAGADVLRSLDQRLQQLAQEIARSEHELDTAKERRAKIDQRMHESDALRAQTASLLARAEADAGGALQDAVSARIAALAAEASGEQALSFEDCDRIQAQVAERLRASLRAEEDRLTAARSSIVQAMCRFGGEFPRSSAGLDARLEASCAHRERLERLCGETLPNLAADFERAVVGDLRDELASFDAALAGDRALVLERVRRLNSALARIDHAPGYSVALEAVPSDDAEIRAFRAALGACADAPATQADAKDAGTMFDRMRGLVERLCGRTEGAADDGRWRSKVADARNAFVYRALAHWRGACGDDVDAGGLDVDPAAVACTVFAAQLASEFELDSRAGNGLRFAVLGMGAAGGADACLRHALDLYLRLDVQVLVAAQLAKVPLIEPFVARVGFVHERDGTASLRNVAIELRG